MPATRVRELLSDGGKHLFDGFDVIPAPCAAPVEKIRKQYTWRKPHKHSGIYFRLRAMKVGDEPLIELKKYQTHPGGFASHYPEFRFKTRSLPCGKLVRIWRIA